MRKLISAALLLAAVVGIPSVASAHDRDGWYDRDRREWRGDDRYWGYRPDYREDRRYWRHNRYYSDARGDWRDERDRRYERRRWGRDVLCRTEWYHGYRQRVCYRR